MSQNRSQLGHHSIFIVRHHFIHWLGLDQDRLFISLSAVLEPAITRVLRPFNVLDNTLDMDRSGLLLAVLGVGLRLLLDWFGACSWHKVQVVRIFASLLLFMDAFEWSFGVIASRLFETKFDSKAWVIDLELWLDFVVRWPSDLFFCNLVDFLRCFIYLSKVLRLCQVVAHMKKLCDPDLFMEHVIFSHRRSLLHFHLVSPGTLPTEHCRFDIIGLRCILNNLENVPICGFARGWIRYALVRWPVGLVSQSASNCFVINHCRLIVIRILVVSFLYFYLALWV